MKSPYDKNRSFETKVLIFCLIAFPSLIALALFMQAHPQ